MKKLLQLKRYVRSVNALESLGLRDLVKDKDTAASSQGRLLKANSHRHARHDRTVLSCLVWRCELTVDHPTVSSVSGLCRAAQCDRRTHSDAEHTCRAGSIHTA